MKIPLVIVLGSVNAQIVFNLTDIVNNQEPVFDKQGLCLAEAIYFEARSEPIKAQLAVAQVIINRTNDPRWPNSICKVIRQREWVRNGCQFSYRCDGKPETITDYSAYQLARKIASVAMNGLWYDVTGGSTHFISRTKKIPEWTYKAHKRTIINRITFYYEPHDNWK